MNLSRRSVSLLLVFAFVFAAAAAFAVSAGKAALMLGTGADSDYDGIPDEYDAEPYSNVFPAQMRSCHEDQNTAVSFTVDFRDFFEDNAVYQPDLASFSVIGSALAYYNTESNESAPTFILFDTIETWEGGTVRQAQGPELLPVFGFKDIANYTLDHYGGDDICELTVGHRLYTYAGETKEIVALWVRGTEPKSSEEWSSNFNMGDLARFFDDYDCAEDKTPRQPNDDWTRKTNHRGFDVCATRLLSYLKNTYFPEFVQPELDSHPEASLTNWLTGHSRGTAVANLMASYIIDEGGEVYAYTYAAPNNTANTEASAERYDCIFNLVNTNDFVPMLPMTEWGFTRYGKTAMVDASEWKTEIRTATGVTYDGNYLSSGDMSTLLSKFICITGENADRDNPGKILGWREVYVYHCGHGHAGETNGDHQSTTFVSGQSWTNWFGPSESDWNGYPVRMKKYSRWEGGICETPAYCMQVLVELLARVAKGETLGGGWDYLTSHKLADKFDFDKQSLMGYASKLTEPHFMDTYAVVQAKITEEGDPGARFTTLAPYTLENADGGRPAHFHTYTYVPYEGCEPTCTEPGLGYRYCLCSECGEDFYDDYQKNVVIPPLGHDWGEPVYVWSGDHTECTASRACLRDAGHTETETVNASYAVVTEPTYEAPGLGRFTAVFENEAFAVQTIDEVIPQLTGLLGDADVSGAVNVTDALLAMRHAMNIITLEGRGFANADVNGDGFVTTVDALAIMRLALLNGK